MKKFLVIPMGGVGQRFIKSGYKTYKPFLPIDRNLTVIENIINNFSKKNTEIIDFYYCSLCGCPLNKKIFSPLDPETNPCPKNKWEQ